MTCVVEGYVGATREHGYCERHYTQWRRHSDPLHQKRRYHKGIPAEERFKAYVQKELKPKACWE